MYTMVKFIVMSSTLKVLKQQMNETERLVSTKVSSSLTCGVTREVKQ